MDSPLTHLKMQDYPYMEGDLVTIGTDGPRYAIVTIEGDIATIWYGGYRKIPVADLIPAPFYFGP